MSSFTYTEIPSAASLDRLHFQEGTHDCIEKTIVMCRRDLVWYFLFYLLFFALVATELWYLLSCFSAPALTVPYAYGVAALFFTLFAFFPLRLAVLTRRFDARARWVKTYVVTCQQALCSQKESNEYHLAMATNLFRLASKLHNLEADLLLPPWGLSFLALPFQRVGARLFWEDIWRFKELLLICAVDEHIELVKRDPISPQVHAALANAYVLLSGAYTDAQPCENFFSILGNSANTGDLAVEKKRKFRRAAECAIEEFKILKDLAPSDPWVHAQLAYSYSDLKMPELEIQEYEIIVALRPDDKEALYKLGTLYFHVGANAKGLRVYETLKQHNSQRAADLIELYGKKLHDAPCP